MNVSDQGKRAMQHSNIKLSHQNKRMLAWKVLVAVILFFVVTAIGGLLHFTLSTVDPLISIWFLVVTFLSIAMFGLGYILRDKMPARMNARCKRFYFMGKEFGVWHWTRAQIYLADLFLVGLFAALYGWAASHTIPLVLLGTSLTAIVPLFHVPLFYVPLWVEIVVEGGLIVSCVIGFIYYTRTWLLNNRADLCYFEGGNFNSPGIDHDCDPSSVDCYLNENYK